MKRKYFGIGATVLMMTLNTGGISNLLSVGDLNPSPVLAQTAEEQVASRVYAQASPAVVTVKTGNGHGSGFIVSNDGLIVTNAHVVDDAPEVVTVVFHDGRQAAADVIGFAKGGLDLAVLRIYNQENVPVLPLADFDSVREGHRVYAIGTPLEEEFRNTLTQGNVSRIDRQEGIIQTNADISPGNSGGPLLNSQGQVVGVNTLVRKGNVTDRNGNFIGYTAGGIGINFAISVDRVQSFLSAVREGDLSPVSTLPDPNEAPPITTITLNGSPIQGTLQEGDRRFRNGSYLDLYNFVGRAGQQVILETDSDEINSQIYLYQVRETEEGRAYPKIAENDDRAPGDFNSRIVITLPEDGIYLVGVSSLERGETGNYSLQTRTTP